MIITWKSKCAATNLDVFVAATFPVPGEYQNKERYIVDSDLSSIDTRALVFTSSAPWGFTNDCSMLNLKASCSSWGDVASPCTTQLQEVLWRSTVAWSVDRFLYTMMALRGCRVLQRTFVQRAWRIVDLDLDLIKTQTPWKLYEYGCIIDYVLFH